MIPTGILLILLILLNFTIFTIRKETAMTISFDDSLITGNNTIDSQHRELIDKVKTFVDACENGDAKVKAIKMLDYLEEYTIFHFDAEEKLMKDVSYPGLANHHEKHEEFKKSISSLREFLDEIDGPNDQFMLAVKENVVEWLFGHIKTFDRSIAEFIFLTDHPQRL